MMDYTALLKESQTEGVFSSRQVPSLYLVCQQLTDGRKARGKRYELAGILLVLVWAKLAGMSSVLAVSEWARVSGDSDQQECGSWVETYALCQYLQLCPGAIRQSTGQCPSGRMVCAPDGPTPRRRSRRPTRSPGHRWENAEKHRWAGIWRRSSATTSFAYL